MGIHSVAPPAKIRTTYKTVTLTGAAGLGATGTNVVIYTVTGEVYLHALICFCTTGLDEAMATAVVTLGTVTQVSRFIGNTNSVDINTNEAWVSTTPTAGSIDLPDAMQSVIVVNGDDIVVVPTVQNTNAGVLEFTVYWEPISTDGNLVAA